jgi:hypothetical protein
VKSFGYISFSIDGRIEKGKIKTTIFDILMVVWSFSYFAAIIYLNINNDLTLISTKNVLIDMGNRGVTLFTILNVFLSSIINTLRRHKIWGCFIQISNFDSEVD